MAICTVKGAMARIGRFLGITSFNPRTREGCDSNPYPPPTFPACFNPRTREGCDFCKANNARKEQVSIHAPVKGAMGQRLRR